MSTKNNNLIYLCDAKSILHTSMKELSFKNSVKRLSPQTKDQFNIESLIHGLTIGIKRLFDF